MYLPSTVGKHSSIIVVKNKEWIILYDKDFKYIGHTCPISIFPNDLEAIRWLIQRPSQADKEGYAQTAAIADKNYMFVFQENRLYRIPKPVALCWPLLSKNEKKNMYHIFILLRSECLSDVAIVIADMLCEIIKYDFTRYKSSHEHVLV